MVGLHQNTFDYGGDFGCDVDVFISQPIHVATRDSHDSAGSFLDRAGWASLLLRLAIYACYLFSI